MSEPSFQAEVTQAVAECVSKCMSVAAGMAAQAVRAAEAVAVRDADRKPKRSNSARVNYDTLCEQVFTYLAKTGEAGVSLKVIHESMSDGSVAQVRKALRNLIDEGRVEQIGERRGAKYKCAP